MRIRPSLKPMLVRSAAASVFSLAGALLLPALASAGVSPEIRISAANPVPACVTPERLMAFLKSRNRSLDPRYKALAAHYKQAGETWRVRWDYAFFQMAVETNFLTYRAPNGRMGDVDPKQNNFAGIGTTGGGVPGDTYPDMKTGVLAQIQHLVVYSGEEIAQPVAPRTQLKQPQILLKTRAQDRPMRFSDLARRWAADPKYGNSIEWVADSYRAEHCRGKQPSPAAAEVLPWAKSSEAQTDRGNGLATTGSVEVAQADSPPHAYRTIWNADDARKAKASPKVAAEASPKPAEPKPPVAKSVAAPKPEPEPIAKAVVPAAAVAEPPVFAVAPAATATEGTATAEVQDEEPTAGFALFTPPANFGTVTVTPSPASPSPPSGGAAPAQEVASSSKPAFDPAANPPSGLGVKPPSPCSFDKASYGGTKAVLIRVADGGQTRYVALTVLDGFEKTLTDSYIRVRAAGGETVGEFDTQDAALAKARELCSGS